MIKVSIVVPVYNMETRLKRCLDSLVNQTLKEIELIIINDGSKDKSIEIIRDYEKKYKNIKVIDRENKGISETRNEGISLSKGKYIAFVDSDDYVELDMFEKLYNKIEKDKSDIVVCGYKSFYENSEEVLYTNIENKCNITSINDNPAMIYKMDYAPWNKIYRKDLWNDIRFPEGVKYEDLEAVLKVFLKAKKITYLDAYLYNYLLNPKGETATINDRVFDIYIILNNLFEEFKSKNQKLKRAFKELYISKIFIYNHFILNTENREMSIRFINQGYKEINNHFKCWKISYILKSKGIKNLIIRVLQTNKYLYYKYINYRTKENANG